MNPLLLASACTGSWRALSFLLRREDGPANMVPTRQFLKLLEECGTTSTGIPDVEDGREASQAALLEGVTIEGDAVLHVLSTCGDGENFVQSTGLVYSMAKHLLIAQNRRGETPLHCAARAGRPKMVYHLIALAGGEADNGEMLREILRKVNVRNETALHEAVRLGSKHTVEHLMAADPELARFPDEGTSPLYLAILAERIDIAESLYHMSDRNLSYSGPNGKNALHAAVHRSQEITDRLLGWNIGLTTQGDQNGSTPLHFATSLLRPKPVHHWIHRPWFHCEPCVWDSRRPFKQLLQANMAPMYQSDDMGSFPVHVAGCIGANEAIIEFLDKCPNIAGLRDIMGRTFLHIAVEMKRCHTVSYACKTPSLSWIWNMQDNAGNTALHLAVKHDVQDIFCLLLENLDVQLNITNNNGETPLDLSDSKMHDGIFFAWNPRFLINSALKYCGAKHGNRRFDHFEDYIQPLDEVKESDKITISAQTLSLGSTLMATVAFGASFTLPGDYKDDGTPALSGRYVFDAFIVANSLAFACAGLATYNLMWAGKAMVDAPLRIWHFDIAVFFGYSSVMSLGTAYVLGLYVTLAPVAYMTAVAICVGASILSLCGFMDPLRCRAVAKALYARLGNQALVTFARIIILYGTVLFWPLALSFISGAISAKHRHK